MDHLGAVLRDRVQEWQQASNGTAREPIPGRAADLSDGQLRWPRRERHLVELAVLQQWSGSFWNRHQVGMAEEASRVSRSAVRRCLRVSVIVDDLGRHLHDCGDLFTEVDMGNAEHGRVDDAAGSSVRARSTVRGAMFSPRMMR